MLQHQGCDPHVVRRYWCSLLAQLPVHVRVMMRGLFSRVENPHTLLEKEPAQNRFVARSLAARREPGAEFSNNDKRQPDFVG